MSDTARPSRGLFRTTITTVAPSPFDFPGTAYSHGWAVLEPNCWDGGRLSLTRTERLSRGRVVHLTITGTGSAGGRRVRADVDHEGELQAEERPEGGSSVGGRQPRAGPTPSFADCV
jgi:hypothetical protein